MPPNIIGCSLHSSCTIPFVTSDLGLDDPSSLLLVAENRKVGVDEFVSQMPVLAFQFILAFRLIPLRAMRKMVPTILLSPVDKIYVEAPGGWKSCDRNKILCRRRERKFLKVRVLSQKAMAERLMKPRFEAIQPRRTHKFTKFSCFFAEPNCFR